MFLNLILSMLLAKWLKLPKNRHGAFVSLFTLSNTVFIGMPICTALFGDSSVPYVLVYYMVNTLFFWTVCNAMIRRDGDPSLPIFSLKSLKNLVNAPLIAFVLSIGLVLLNANLPDFLDNTMKYVGNMVTPLSMLFVGIVLARMDWKHMRLQKGSIAVILGRFLLSPALVLGLSLLFDLPELMRNVLVVQAGMPTMTQINIVTRLYNSDGDFAAVITAITTIASLVMIPLYAGILSLL